MTMLTDVYMHKFCACFFTFGTIVDQYRVEGVTSDHVRKNWKISLKFAEL